MNFERNDIIGITKFRLEVVKSGVPATFTIGDVEYGVTEHGAYLGGVIPEVEVELHQLTAEIIHTVMAKIKK